MVEEFEVMEELADNMEDSIEQEEEDGDSEGTLDDSFEEGDSTADEIDDDAGAVPEGRVIEEPNYIVTLFDLAFHRSWVFFFIYTASIFVFAYGILIPSNGKKPIGEIMSCQQLKLKWSPDRNHLHFSYQVFHNPRNDHFLLGVLYGAKFRVEIAEDPYQKYKGEIHKEFRVSERAVVYRNKGALSIIDKLRLPDITVVEQYSFSGTVARILGLRNYEQRYLHRVECNELETVHEEWKKTQPRNSKREAIANIVGDLERLHITMDYTVRDRNMDSFEELLQIFFRNLEKLRHHVNTL